MRFEEDRVVVSAAESGDGPSRAIEFPEGTHLATDPGIVIFLTSGRAVGPETIRIANRSGQEQTLRRDASGKLRRADQPEAAGDRLP
jgi:hypothetical protein